MHSILRLSQPILILIIIFQLLTPGNALAKLAPNDCSKSVTQQIDDTTTDQHWGAFDRNIFVDSIPSLLSSAVSWLTFTQLLRYFVGEHAGESFFSNAFFATLLIDPALTAVSHAVSLIEWPALRKFMDGKSFGPKAEFLARTGINILQGTVVISTTWAVTGIPLSFEKVGGAFALCAGVYPVLQTTKTLLFKQFPLWGDRERSGQLAQRFSNFFPELQARAAARAENVGLTKEQGERLFLSMLEGLITARPIEQEIRDNSPLKDQAEIRTLLEEIKTHSDKIDEAIKAGRKLEQQLHETQDPSAKLILQARQEKQRATELHWARKQMKARRLLIDKLLNLGPTLEIEKILSWGPSVNGGESLEIHRVFSERARNYRKKLVVASLIDQAISVGIAGGVFLYGTTHWAQTGTTPWFVAAPEAWLVQGF